MEEAMNQPVDYKELYITRYGGKLFEETAAEIDGILDAVEQEELRGELCDDLLQIQEGIENGVK